MLVQIKENIAATIGVPYEVIAIDNSNRQYGICAAYNLGASQSQYEVLCFLHEDLRFHTSGWGSTVLRNLASPRAGVLGVAGTTYQVKAPTGWTAAGLDSIRINVLHTTDKPVMQHDHWNPTGTATAPVATLDGLWLCCCKTVWQEFPFNEVAFPHFHFYDIDFCTKIATKYQNLVTFEVLIEHFSKGTFAKDWLVYAVKYYKLRAKHLPFGPLAVGAAEARRLEIHAFQEAIRMMIDKQLSAVDIRYCLYKCLQLAPLNRGTWWLAKQYLKAQAA